MLDESENLLKWVNFCPKLSMDTLSAYEFLLCFSCWELISKVGCVLPMVVISRLLHADLGQKVIGKTHSNLCVRRYTNVVRNAIYDDVCEKRFDI